MIAIGVNQTLVEDNLYPTKIKIMERPQLQDYKPEEINDGADMADWYESYYKALDEYIDYLEDPEFKSGDVISFGEGECVVIENHGSSGVVRPVGETYLVRNFYWEFEGEKCKLVKRFRNP